jgi:hypothetical protein
MKAKSNSIGILPAMNSRLRVHGLGGPIARAGIVRPVRAQAVNSSYMTHSWCFPAHDRLGDFWETLSYTVIWACGLSGIVLCLL